MAVILMSVAMVCPLGGFCGLGCAPLKGISNRIHLAQQHPSSDTPFIIMVS